MKTKYFVMDTEINEQLLNEAVEYLRCGEVVAFPTETVYGLGADATNEKAIRKIFTAKGRPSDNPLIVHIAHKNQLKQLVSSIPDYVERLMNHFSPGPITYILKSRGKVARNVTAGLDTVAVRIPNHPIAQALLKQCPFPVAAPSANLSGKPSPTVGKHVYDDLNGKIAAIIDGGSASVGVESTVIDCTKKLPVILRLGTITQEEIEKVVGPVIVHTEHVETDSSPMSPGMKYKHYAPAVPLLVVTGRVKNIQAIIDTRREKGEKVGLLVLKDNVTNLVADKTIVLGKDLKTITKHLYDALRSFQQPEVDVIVCEGIEEVGIGKTIMDRLKKAADTIIE